MDYYPIFKVPGRLTDISSAEVPLPTSPDLPSKPNENVKFMDVGRYIGKTSI